MVMQAPRAEPALKWWKEQQLCGHTRRAGSLRTLRAWGLPCPLSWTWKLRSRAVVGLAQGHPAGHGWSWDLNPWSSQVWLSPFSQLLCSGWHSEQAVAGSSPADRLLGRASKQTCALVCFPAFIHSLYLSSKTD